MQKQRQCLCFFIYEKLKKGQYFIFKLINNDVLRKEEKNEKRAINKNL